MSNRPIPLPDIPSLQQPANVYYYRPYSFYWPGVFIFVGTFGCSGLTGTVDTSISILLWTPYILGVLIIFLSTLYAFSNRNKSMKMGILLPYAAH